MTAHDRYGDDATIVDLVAIREQRRHQEQVVVRAWLARIREQLDRAKETMR